MNKGKKGQRGRTCNSFSPRANLSLEDHCQNPIHWRPKMCLFLMMMMIFKFNNSVSVCRVEIYVTVKSGSVKAAQSLQKCLRPCALIPAIVSKSLINTPTLTQTDSQTHFNTPTKTALLIYSLIIKLNVEIIQLNKRSFLSTMHKVLLGNRGGRGAWVEEQNRILVLDLKMFAV